MAFDPCKLQHYTVLLLIVCVCVFYSISSIWKKCYPSWRVGRNLISWVIKPPKEGRWGYSTTFISFYFFMPRGSALRSNPLAFRVLFWTKKGPLSYYLLLTNDTPFHMTIVELCIPSNCNKYTFF